MFTLPFLFSPLSFSYQAYKSTRVEVPIMKNNHITFLGTNVLVDQSQVYKGTEEYDQVIKTLPGYNIKIEMQPFFDRMGIRKDLIVTEKLNLGFCTAQGTNYFTKGDAIIWVAPNFQNVDKEACQWVLKHETCHIKNNDNLTIALIPAIYSIAAAIFSTFMLPIIPAIFITLLVGFIAQVIFTRYREGKADDLAIAESSPEELKGGRRFLMSLKETNLEARNTIWKKISISSTGEIRLDLLHPSIASRVRKIEHALQQQNIQVDEEEESKKIAKLKTLQTETNQKLEIELNRMGTFGILMEMSK